MASPPLRGSPEWSATREVHVLLALTRGNYYAAQRLWLQREREKVEASQHASAGSPQPSQQAAKPATAKARDVPKPKRRKSAARLAKDRKRLNHKHLARKVWAFVRVARKLIAWSRRARANLEPMELTQPATPAGSSVAVPESGAELPPFRAEVGVEADWVCRAGGRERQHFRVAYLSITKMAAYQGKSFEELRWEHYSKDDTLEAQAPAEPPAAAQPAPPSQQPSTALVAAARASLDASELQDARGSKRDALARTPPSAAAPERPPPPADARKRPASRGGAQLEAALARAAPAAAPEVQPITADNYATIAIARAANPHSPPA